MKHEREAVARALDAAKTVVAELVALSGNDADATINLAASLFCSLSDDGQAKVFVEIARIMATWEPGAASMQAYSIGRHLRTCECSTSEARNLVAEIADTAGALD